MQVPYSAGRQLTTIAVPAATCDCHHHIFGPYIDSDVGPRAGAGRVGASAHSGGQSRGALRVRAGRLIQQGCGVIRVSFRMCIAAPATMGVRVQQSRDGMRHVTRGGACRQHDRMLQVRQLIAHASGKLREHDRWQVGPAQARACGADELRRQHARQNFVGEDGVDRFFLEQREPRAGGLLEVYVVTVLAQRRGKLRRLGLIVRNQQ